MSELILVLDEGTTSTRALLFTPAGEPRGEVPRRADAALSAPRLGRARRRRDLGQDARLRAADGRPRRGRRAHRGDRHRQPARDRGRVGPADRRAAGPRARVAGPAHRRRLRGAARGRPRGRRCATRPACCSIPTSRPPRCAGCSTTSRRWPTARRLGPAGVRHDRKLARLQAHRRAPVAMPATPAARCCCRWPARAGTRACATLFGVPRAALPEVTDSAGALGTTALFGAPIPICGLAGDQQAATIGQGCLAPGETKATYGTGAFVLANRGAAIPRSDHRLLGTVLHQLGGARHYALEGSVFVAGSFIQWLRDAVGLILTCGRERGARPLGARTAAGWSWSPRSAGSARRTGGPRRAARSAASASPPARRTSCAPRCEAMAHQTHDLAAALRRRRRGMARAADRRRHGGERLDGAGHRRRDRSRRRPAPTSSRPPRSAPRCSRRSAPACIRRSKRRPER